MKKNSKTVFLMAMMMGLGTANAVAQSASWTFYNPDNIRHQGTQTDHTIVVKTRTAPTLADINNDGKLVSPRTSSSNSETVIPPTSELRMAQR